MPASLALIAQENNSAAKTNNKPDKGQSCLTPLFSSKELEAKPYFLLCNCLKIALRFLELFRPPTFSVVKLSLIITIPSGNADLIRLTHGSSPEYKRKNTA